MEEVIGTTETLAVRCRGSDARATEDGRDGVGVLVMVGGVERMKARMEEMMATMEMLVAAMVVLIGVLRWLVKLEAPVTMRITVRCRGLLFTQTPPMNIETPSAVTSFQSQKPPLVSQCH